MGRHRNKALVCFVPVLLTVLIVGQDQPVPISFRKTGYVDCSKRGQQDAVPIAVSACGYPPAGRLGCGQKVEVLEQQGNWMKVSLPDGLARYIEVDAVSQATDRFVAFDAKAGLPHIDAPDCSVHSQKRTPPHVTYDPQPDFTEKARKANIWGTVNLSLTVGADGKAHDIKVGKKLGYGLDEAAVEAVRQWKFEPATADGKPIEARIQVSVTFRRYD